MPEELRLGGVLDSVEVPPRTRGSATRRGSAMASTASGSRFRSSASGSPSSTASQWRSTRRTTGGRSCTLACRTSPSAITAATTRGTAITTSTATRRASSRAASRSPHSSLQARRPSDRRAPACGVTSRPASPSTLYSRRVERSESHAMTPHTTESDTPSPCRRLAEWGADGSQGRAQRHSPTDP